MSLRSRTTKSRGETWIRETDDDDVLGVEAVKPGHADEGSWRVISSVADLLREEPLETEFLADGDQSWRQTRWQDLGALRAVRSSTCAPAHLGAAVAWLPRIRAVGVLRVRIPPPLTGSVRSVLAAGVGNP